MYISFVNINILNENCEEDATLDVRTYIEYILVIKKMKTIKTTNHNNFLTKNKNQTLYTISSHQDK